MLLPFFVTYLSVVFHLPLCCQIYQNQLKYIGMQEIKARAGIVKPSISAMLDLWLGDTSNHTCEVCFGVYHSTQIYGMDCCHRYCLSCWRHHLDSSIEMMVRLFFDSTIIMIMTIMIRNIKLNIS